MHNLSREGYENTLTDPNNEFRAQSLQVNEVDFEMLRKENKDSLEKEEVSNLSYSCQLCTCAFESEVALEKHQKTKQPDAESENTKECKICGNIMSSVHRLKTHVKTHFTCSICAETFESNPEMLAHKKSHSTCKICQSDYVSKSKLLRHMSSVHK